jgi:hypothetical protein
VERLQRVEELEEDMRLLALAWARMLTDSGERLTTEPVAAEFGIDPSEDDEEE